MNKKMLPIKNTRFLITGGSGSLGRNIIKRLLDLGAEKILSISRDEGLIKEAENEINSSFVRFKLGDIADKELIANAMKDIDVVFHTAAIKHVSLAEQNPREAHRVNILGLLNILNSSQLIKRLIYVSSDKAINVTNCYGATKLLAEYLVKESVDLYSGTTFIIARCPNLLGSRGSVLPLWEQQLKKDNKIKITDPEMTRYFINIPDAAKFLVDVGLATNPDSSKIFYPLEYTKKFKLKSLAQAFLKVRGNKYSSIETIGASPGEKKHEDYIANCPLMSIKELTSVIKINSAIGNDI
ncbi:SDR family NAD(P)-dependent oxidoreductase [Patescibacteria group bacterium]|nr:SDR family NAD(P)-dependent oxidoreductase [Patescibacteria group bacterium]MBU1953025.1 SDR family NAD(P)-dependent oxidoreductase [Patescibacteria group bacterium]